MSDSLWRDACVLTENLAAAWNGGRDVLSRIAGEDPRVCPWSALQEMGPSGLQERFESAASRDEMRQAARALETYLEGETWFERIARHDGRLEAFAGHPVAYFCAEFGLADWLPIYSGGLGVLAGDVLKEASDLGLPFVGIGLFYRHGFFQQRLDEWQYQREEYVTLDPQRLPLKVATDASGKPIVIEVPLEGRAVQARAWMLAVGRTTLYLLDTDVEENERPEDRALTSGLYAGDQEMRVRQEVVLGIGGVRLLRALDIVPAIYSMNEGHAAFLAVELLIERLRSVGFEEALDAGRREVVYTNHTVVPAGNDVFPRDLVAHVLGPYVNDAGLPLERLFALGGEERFSMALLAFETSGRANAVSSLHGDVIPREWPGFDVEVVTNGVHVPTWLGPDVRALLDQYVPDWRGDSPAWEAIHDIPDDALWEARNRQRAAMIADVARRADAHLDPDTLTLAWARRFAEYKRAGLIARDADRLAALLADPSRPMQLLISGKAHPRDEGGKHIMQDLIQRLRGDERTRDRVAFIEDYSLAAARSLTLGADVWLNTPRKPLEASGTSGMKSSDNGGLQLTVRDGWAAEVDWWDVGWGVEGGSDEGDAEALYSYLEGDVRESFYGRTGGVPVRWVEMMKNTMIITLSRYSARRMMLDYIHKLYLPLTEEQETGFSAAD